MIQRATLLHPVYTAVLRQICILLFIAQLIRFCFFIANHQFFYITDIGQYLGVVWYSLRFDLSALFSINALYLVIRLFPSAFISRKAIQVCLQILFILTNVLAFIFDLADIAYFPYVRKRMTADVFDLIGRKSDFIDLLPNYLVKFWYVGPLIALLIVLLVLLSRQSFSKVEAQHFSFRNLLIYLLAMGVSLVAIRGGVQLRPLTLSNAMVAGRNENIPLLINTPFSLIQTLESQKLRRMHFMDEREVQQFYHPVKIYQRETSFKPMNVVVIVLESFGKAFTGIGGRTSYTPFLDSIMQQGMTFTHAFANASRSADGIPAVLSGMPYLMNDAFPMSPYATNQIDALPGLLKAKGYTTSFFHGGANGTMNFDSYSRNAGFDRYFGRKEYGHDADYDGTWGIWDEPFLQYFCRQLNKQQQPFCSAVFTLSSHEPFHLPQQYADSPFASLQGINRGVWYTDLALRKFFETASRTDWYANTLFVITADHHYLAYQDPKQYYQQGMGLFAIPIVFFQPGNEQLRGYNTRLMQQIDIMPSVLDLLHYDHPFFSFGNSAFDTTVKPFVFTALDNQYFMLQEPWLIRANVDKVQGYFRFPDDSLMQRNFRVNPDSSFAGNEKRFHAFLQWLNNSVLDNRQSLRTLSPR